MKKELTTNEFVAIVVKEELHKGDEGEAVKVGDYYVAEMHMAGTSKKWFIFDAEFNHVSITGQTHFGTRQIAINMAVDLMVRDAKIALRELYLDGSRNIKKS